MDEAGACTLVQTVRAHRGEVTCLDVCGALLATGGGDKVLRVWCWEHGSGWRESATAKLAHRYGVTATRWAAADTGALLASAGVDGAARIWSRALVAVRTLGAPGAVAARALCWVGGGGRLLVGHDDGTLCVWSTARGALLARLSAHEGALHAVAAPAAGALLLTACTHGVLKVFDLVEVCARGTEGGAALAPLEWVDGAHDMGALCADAVDGGTLAATGGHDACVRVWRAESGMTGRRLRACGDPLEGHAAAVTALRWALGGALLASASLDRTARLWTPATVSTAGACVRVLHAHPRYLTCIALSPDLRFLITGSNDKSVRMWSLGAFSLEDDLEAPCATLAHFALGDLEGIGPVVTNEVESEDGQVDDEAESGGTRGGARRAWGAPLHTGAINCIAVHHDLLATASSDGLVKIFRWHQDEGELVERHTLDGHQYPALAVDFGAGGKMLLTAGLDGRACIWDVETGVLLRSLCVPSGAGSGAVGSEAGGGGVRGARVSPHRPPLLLLATDDGLAPLWSLSSDSPRPDHTYTGHAEAVTCCAWSADGRVGATGAASGELRLLAPPPTPALLHHESHAHDLGVQSCDFAPSLTSTNSLDREYLLATAGCDGLIKLWFIELDEDGMNVTVRMVRQVEAHGGGVASVRWGSGFAAGLIASGGADRWARVWRVAARGAVVALHAAAPVEGAGGALSAALLSAGDEQALLLAVGSMGGGVSLWHVPPPPPITLMDEGEEEDELEEGEAPRFWGTSGVVRWLREYITRVPGLSVSHEIEMELLKRAREASLSGAQLLDAPLHELLDELGYGEVPEADPADAESEIRARLCRELKWLRRDPPPASLAEVAPHALLCPLTHRLLWRPVRASDGFTYEGAALHEWRIAGGEVSPVSGRALGSLSPAPNYRLRARLHDFLDEHAPAQ